ncbi:MAG: response regulator [Cellvibrionaceae bacterium]|nr:response regulator [Cellvibrionaceae bacterium]
MALKDPGKLHVLVVDDFSSFRSTMSSMLNKLGVKNIEEASKAFEVLKWCKDRKFDLIFCDYNLGPGKNGQQLLEELRFRKLISRHTLFVMVTAEASKDMVLSAYDCEPDDYLMKPLNLQVLEQRFTRLVQTRDALVKVYQLLEAEDLAKATDELKQLVEQRGRHTSLAQKLLGEILLQQRRYQEAESLYQEVLAGGRRLDWAVLGLAKVHYAQGDIAGAKQELSELIDESRLFLPAHDEIANILEQERDFDALQVSVEKAVELCPRSILRQRRLAQVAENNGDVGRTLRAAVDAMKLGEFSCHQDTSDALRFLNAAANSLEHNIEVEKVDVLDESKRCLDKLMSTKRMDVNQELHARLLMARVEALSGRVEDAKQTLRDQNGLLKESTGKNVDMDLAYVAYLNSIGQLTEAGAHLKTMAQLYEKDPASMEKLDKLLPEPRSEANRRRVAQLNKTGIELYKEGHYDEALRFFNRATLLYPRHIGLQLNRLQTLIAKVKAEPADEVLRAQMREQLEKVDTLLAADPNPTQLERFRQLRDKTRQVA